MLVKLAAGGVLAVGSAVAYVHYGLRSALSVPKSRVTIAVVVHAPFAEYVPLTGGVVPIKTVYLDAIEGGQVTDVFVEEGARVVSGQPLVKLRNSRQQLEVMRLEAELTQQLNQLGTAKLSFAQATLQHEREAITAQAQLEQMEQRHARRLQLLTSGAVSRADIEDSALELKRDQQLLEALRRAQAVDTELQSRQVTRIEQAAEDLATNLGLARDTLASLTINAPISGQLTTLNVSLGESAAPGQRIGQIDALDSSKVTAHVDEFYLARIHPGQAADTEVDGTPYSLTITKVYPEVRERKFKVDFQFAASAPPAMRFGQTLQLRLDLGNGGKALQVANGPFFDSSADGVFVLSTAGDSAERRRVKLGRRTTDSVEVISGLTPGERIVSSSYESYDGIEVLRFREGNAT